MAYTKYSLTPANNNAAPPDGAPEGMLPSAVNDTMRDMMAQIRDCGDGIRGGTYTMTAPVITGGSINGASVGASSSSTGAFTTLAYTGTLTGGTGVVNLGSGQFYKDASGNIGIGTSSPSTYAKFAVSDGTVVGVVAPYTVGSLVYYGSATNHATAFITNAVEKMRIDTSGNVTVGATTAFSKFGVSTANGNLGLTGGNTSGGNKIQSFGATTTSNGYLAFEGYTAEYMRITSTGNVGIGTDNPASKFHVVGSEVRFSGAASKVSLNLRSTSGTASWMHYTEEGVADRGATGFAAGSINYQIRTNGAYDLSTGTLSATVNPYGIGVGTAVPSSGVGVSFPATQSASSDANTLDDYEEGTWTPTDASGAGLSFTATAGYYVKIGRYVMASAQLTFPATASGSTATIGGLPFATGADGTRTAFITYTNSSADNMNFTASGQTSLYITKSDGTLQANSFCSGRVFYFAASYITA